MTDKIVNHLKPSLVLIMGVSGSGKSTLAEAFALRHDFTFLDADDFHSEQAIAMMHQGIPLTDPIRESWIGRINQRLKTLALKEKNVVLAFSGLKRSYRAMILDIGFRKYSFLLDIDKAELKRRLAQRKAHFFNPQLLDSQLATLEPASGHESISALPLKMDIQALLEIIEQQVFNQDNGCE